MEFEVFEPFIQLVLALTLGGLLGLERTLAGKTAGLRTFGLAGLGACLFTMMSMIVFTQYGDIADIDPLRVASGVVTGIGFIGAGLIIFTGESKVRGLTTAAGLWVAAAIGVAIGFELYLIGVFTTLLTLFAFTVLWFVEDRFRALPTERNERTVVVEKEDEVTMVD